VATGDRRRVEQIVTNLAANALKFTPPGGHVEIEGRFDGLVATVTVRDDGAGIPFDDRDRIFERFHRMADHERVTGTGLGLPIARDLARRMDGDLGVASVPDGGSAFVLVLPGPAEVSPEVVAATLVRNLAREDQDLEERLVRRALATGPGDLPFGGSERALRAVASSGGGVLRVVPSRRPEPAQPEPLRPETRSPA
jgi:hypothetical protein